MHRGVNIFAAEPSEIESMFIEKQKLQFQKLLTRIWLQDFLL